MRLRLNGKDREVPAVSTVEELVRHLGIHRMIVVEHNGVIVDRERYAAQLLGEGDTLEIVHIVGGGCDWGLGIGDCGLAGLEALG